MRPLPKAGFFIVRVEALLFNVIVKTFPYIAGRDHITPSPSIRNTNPPALTGGC